MLGTTCDSARLTTAGRRQSRSAVTTNPMRDRGEPDPGRLPDGVGQIEADEERDRRGADHRRRRERVEDVLDRERRHRRAERHAVAHEGGLGRLAREEPQGRQVPDRVPGDDGGEGGPKRQRMRRFEAERPRQGPHREPQAGERDDGGKAPADLRESAPDLPEPDFRHEPGEEDQPERGGRRCR